MSSTKFKKIYIHLNIYQISYSIYSINVFKAFFFDL